MKTQKSIWTMATGVALAVLCHTTIPAARSQEAAPSPPAAIPPASVQPAGPPKLSTNPCKHVIFPAKSQTPAQQEQDQLDAYNWATQQTGWDPYKATSQQAQLEGKAAEVSGATRGAAVGGAARGALVGVAVGAIAGDAGEGAAIGATAGGMASGMRGRKMRKQVKTGTEAAQTDYQQKLASWDKHFIAAMKGKGYTVE